MKIKNQLLKLTIFALLFAIHYHLIAITDNDIFDNNSNKTAAEVSANSPALVAVFMMRNEEHVVVETLQPYVDAGITHFFFFDTGSLDLTAQKAQDFFKQNNLEYAYVVQECVDVPSEEDPNILEFDFSVGRNRALELAEEKFPDAAFMLFPDAEWHLHNGQALLEFCKKNSQKTNITYYLVKVIGGCNIFYTPRLLCCKSKVRFEGDIHEVPNIVSERKVNETIYFKLNGTTKGYEKSKKRWERDLVKLHRRYKKNPQDARTIFYLAQTYECLDDLENAKKYYLLKTETPSWPEENYATMYKLAQVTEQIANQSEKPDYTDALEYYSKAYALRPIRAEPLVRMGQIYWKLHNFTLCFAVAKMAYDLPVPTDDTLVVNSYIYNFERFELMSKAACWVGLYKLGEIATRKILEFYPDEPQYYQNLAIYLSKQRLEAQLKNLKEKQNQS